MKYAVKVVEYGSELVVKTIECDNERAAEKVEAGLTRQLNHDKYFTRVVSK